MATPKEPQVTPELIRWLEQHFSDKLPESYPGEAEIAHRIGQVSVIRHLKHLHKKQTEIPFG